MKKSLRFIGLSVSSILFISVLAYVFPNDALSQVTCPCDFESVPKDKGCWTEQFSGEPSYTQPGQGEECLVVNVGDTGTLGLLVIQQQQSFCSTKNTIGLARCGPSTTISDLTPEELKACQCELQAYATALNEVAGISVTGGPPYVCGDVDCRTLSPIPTLSEWGLISMAAILGIIGYMVIRRRKVTA
jgi:hypothetical protein